MWFEPFSFLLKNFPIFNKSENKNFNNEKTQKVYVESYRL